jgi:urease accessory protein
MDEGTAHQLTAIDVGPSAYVEHLPEPLIPQAGSRYEQETLVELDDGARIVLAETLAPGRLARGERFQFDLLQLTMTIRSRGTDVCRETLRLDPPRATPARRGIVGRYSYVGTLLAVAPSLETKELADDLDAAVRAVEGTLGAAGMFAREAGAFVRILADSPRAMSRALTEAWRVARERLLGEEPPLRRRK